MRSKPTRRPLARSRSYFVPATTAAEPAKVTRPLPRGLAYEALEARLHLSVTRDLNGFTVPNPSADSRVIYVSATGSDTNNGFSTSSAVQTIAKARSLLRNGSPDYLLLRRGDTFGTPISNWSLSGRSADEPMVIGAYTDPSRPSTDRPRINSGIASGFANTASGSNHPPI